MTQTMRKNTKQRLKDTARRLFAEKGFAGASVRDICAEASAGRNMIHHYFGNKEGLFKAVLDDFSNESFVVPLRVIADPPMSRAEMVFKLEYFIRETLEALIDQRLVFKILVREQSDWQEFRAFRDDLVQFLQHAQTAGFVRADANIEMIPGSIMDRLGNQVLFAAMSAEREADNVTTDLDYRSKWVKDCVSLLLFGFVSAEKD